MKPRFCALLLGLGLTLWAFTATAEDSPVLRQSVQPPTLTVFVDTRLYPVAKEAAKQMERGGWLFFNFVVDDSPKLLERMIAKPEAADLWLLEGEELVKLLLAAGFAAKDDVLELAKDRLVWVRKEGKPDDEPFAVFAPKSTGLVGLPDPERTQCGLHAVQALKRLGYAAQINDRLRPFANAQLALKALLDGAIQAAVVYQSDLPKDGPLKAGLVLPRQAYLPIVYYGGPRPKSPLISPARAFLVFLSAPERQGLFKNQGFSPIKD